MVGLGHHVKLLFAHHYAMEEELVLSQILALVFQVGLGLIVPFVSP